jgi:hypothetical protein
MEDSTVVVLTPVASTAEDLTVARMAVIGKQDSA